MPAAKNPPSGSTAAWTVLLGVALLGALGVALASSVENPTRGLRLVGVLLAITSLLLPVRVFCRAARGIERSVVELTGAALSIIVATLSLAIVVEPDVFGALLIWLGVVIGLVLTVLACDRRNRRARPGGGSPN